MSLLTNLVSYYKLDGNSNDSVGSNNGTDTAITYSLANGKINQGAGFNGTSSRIQAPITGLPLSNSSRTVASWFKTTTSVTKPILQYGSVTAVVGTQYIHYIINNKAYFSGFGADVSGTKIVNDGNWHHFVTTYDGTTLNVYVDGALDGSGNISLNTGTGNSLLAIGDLEVSGSTFFPGSIDEVGIWSRALSATEVSQLYNNGAGNQYPFYNQAITRRRGFLMNM